MARTPRNGLASAGRSNQGNGLSPPMSASRMTTGRSAPKAARISRYAAVCSSSSGGRDRSMNRNSVRRRPTPSAPASRARWISRGEPMLAIRRRGEPSAVAARQAGWLAVRSRRRCSAPMRPSKEARSSASGPITISPVRPSMATTIAAWGASAPSNASEASSSAASRPGAATTAGMPRARARMAAWATGVPPCSAIPSSRPLGSSAATDGGRSSASAMDGTVGGAMATPRRMRTIRSPTSRTSVARAASSGSARLDSEAAIIRAAAVSASATSAPAAMRRSASSSNDGSSAIIACASRMAASSTAPRVRNPPARSSSWRAACRAAAARSIGPGSSLTPTAGRLAATGR